MPISRRHVHGQLLIRINFERVRDEPGPFDVKIVYNKQKES